MARINQVLNRSYPACIQVLARHENQRQIEQIEMDRIAAEMRAKGYVPTWDLYAKDTEFDKFGRAWRFKAFLPDVAKFVVF